VRCPCCQPPSLSPTPSLSTAFPRVLSTGAPPCVAASFTFCRHCCRPTGASPRLKPAARFSRPPLSAALFTRSSLEDRIGPPDLIGLAPSTWQSLGRYMDPSAFALRTYRSLRPSGLHCNLAAAEHRSWSFAEDRHSSRCAFVTAFTATDLRSRRTSALWLLHLAMPSATQDFHHAPCFELPDRKGSPPSLPAACATRRSRCPEQLHRAPLSAR